MQAGLDAPSGCNKQTTSLIAVDDPGILTKFYELMEMPASKAAPAAPLRKHLRKEPGSIRLPGISDCVHNSIWQSSSLRFLKLLSIMNCRIIDATSITRAITRAMSMSASRPALSTVAAS